MTVQIINLSKVTEIEKIVVEVVMGWGRFPLTFLFNLQPGLLLG